MKGNLFVELKQTLINRYLHCMYIIIVKNLLHCTYVRFFPKFVPRMGSSSYSTGHQEYISHTLKCFSTGGRSGTTHFPVITPGEEYR